MSAGLVLRYAERGSELSFSGSYSEINYQRLADHLSFSVQKVYQLRQVHGNHIVTATDAASWVEADGLIGRSEQLLTIRVADCMALLFYCPRQGLTAAIHAGWRGVDANIHTKAVSMLVEKGGDLSRILVWASPCISQKYFEVGEEVASKFQEIYVDRKNYSKPHVNLKRRVFDDLVAMGLSKANIEIDAKCTFEDEQAFHSFRRDGEKSGRMLAFIGMKA